jgi:hypothetical protein
MKSGLYEVENFAAGTLARIEKGPFELDGDVYDLSRTGKIFIPLSQEIWRRIKTFWENTPEPDDVSKHWQKRKKNFLYLYSTRQQCLLAAGYYHSGYVGRFIDGLAQNMNMQTTRSRQSDLFQNFQQHMGPMLRSWYPMLPGMVEFHDLAKNFDIAMKIVDLLNGDERPLRILEIGAGGCLLPLFLRKLLTVERYDVIDLPLLMPLGAANLSFFAPEVKMSLPGEEQDDSWIIFKPAATATQDSAADPEGYDVLVNVTSFMEMTDVQVEGYFRLIARSMRPGSLFVCVNRGVKLTRFADYPWHLINGEIVVDTEDLSSRFFRDEQTILRRVIRRS